MVPDLLKKGYFWLRCSGLHPETLIDLHPIIVVLMGMVLLAPLVATAMFTIYEVISAMTNENIMYFMENIPLATGLAQVKEIN